MKKFLCLLMAIVCASATVFSLASCSSLGGNDDGGDDVTVSEKVTEEQWNNAFNLSTNLKATIIETFKELEDGLAESDWIRTYDMTYEDEILSINYTGEGESEGTSVNGSDNKEGRLENLIVGDLFLYCETFFGKFPSSSVLLFQELSYEDFSYSDSCYIYSVSDEDNYSSDDGNDYEKTETLHDGKWVWIPLDDQINIEDIIVMLKIKRRPNRK